MAITLQITDGTDTVDLNDGSNLYLGAAFQMNVGQGAVTEQIIAGWANSLDADAKALISKKFNRLIRKAILHFQNQRIDRAVWLVWKPDDQTDTQYAKVMGGGEVEIVKHTVGGFGGGYFNPTIIREGEWRSVAPDGTAGTSVVSGSTLYNKVDADGDNEIDIPASRTNDAPAMLKITVENNANWDNLIIAMKRFANTTEANKFTSHFAPADHDDGLTITTADTSAPKDARFSITALAAATVFPYWTLTTGQLGAFKGSYDVYTKAYVGSSEEVTVSFRTSINATGPITATLSESSTDNLIYLGNVSLPGADLDPFTSVNSSINIGLSFVYGTGATVECFGMWLVPADIPPFAVTCANVVSATNDGLAIDGITETTFEYDVTSGNAKFDAKPEPRGRYLTSTGGEVNRLFFYVWEGTDYQHNDSMTVDVNVVDRFMGLRGNT